MNDAPLVPLIDASLPFRLLARAGDRITAAWPGSAAARALAAWAAVRLERRVRLTAITLFVAIVTHLVLTRFSAPEPTWGARAAWIVILAVVVAVGAGARGVAAAWMEWTVRRAQTDHR